MKIDQFLYQIKKAKVTPTTTLGADLIIVDADELTKQEIAVLRRDGATKVLSYISVGMGDNTRSYWKPKAPWLDDIPKSGKRYYRVKFWSREWMTQMRKEVDRSILSGCDGIFLDNVLAFRYAETPREPDMIELVLELANYARQKSPGYVVIPQDGEVLLENREYREAIDGIVKRNLIFDHGDDVRMENITAARARLTNLQLQKKPVLVVEYLPSKKQEQLDRVTAAERKLRSWGYTPLVTDQQ